MKSRCIPSTPSFYYVQISPCLSTTCTSLVGHIARLLELDPGRCLGLLLCTSLWQDAGCTHHWLLKPLWKTYYPTSPGQWGSILGKLGLSWSASVGGYSSEITSLVPLDQLWHHASHQAVDLGMQPGSAQSPGYQGSPWLGDRSRVKLGMQIRKSGSGPVRRAGPWGWAREARQGQ